MLVRKDSKIIAVDGSRMAMFKNIGEAFAPVLELIEEHKNPSLRTSELGTDRPGRSFQDRSATTGRRPLCSGDDPADRTDHVGIRRRHHIGCSTARIGRYPEAYEHRNERTTAGRDSQGLWAGRQRTAGKNARQT